MTDRRFIEQLLHLNGVANDAPEGELRSLFREAGWQEAEIDAAIADLRRVPASAPAAPKPNSAASPPRSSAASDQMSALLGVEVVVDPSLVRDRETHALVKKQRGGRGRILVWTSILLIAILVAVLGGLGALYVMQLGPYQGSAPADVLE